MDSVGAESSVESTGQSEPTEPDVLEIDPTSRYIRVIFSFFFCFFLLISICSILGL